MGGAMKPLHWLIILLVLIIVFGASRLPNIAKNVGQSAKVLKKEMRELTDDEQEQSKPGVQNYQNYPQGQPQLGTQNPATGAQNPMQPNPETMPAPSQHPGTDPTNPH